MLDKVGKTIICFQDVPSRPDWSMGRAKSLSNYPKKAMTSLALTESEVFAGARWPNPEIADYGLQVSRAPGTLPGYSGERYMQNFERLKRELRRLLFGCRDVFTHNPWGEYGHEEHVQVFRAVDALREELGFRLWVSNYFSNKSHGLMLRYMAAMDGHHFSLPTRPALGKRLQALYSRNGCWTWFDDYRWPESEVFIEWKGESKVAGRAGAVIPMNIVRVDFSGDAPAPRWRRLPGRAWRRAKAILRPGASG